MPLQVGSSFELAQRLEEPPLRVVPSATLQRSPSPPFLYPSHARSADTRVSKVSAPMHIFDVDRSSGAIEIWRRMINTPPYQGGKTLQPSSLEGKDRATQSTSWEDGIPERPTNDLEVEVDESDNLSREAELQRERELDGRSGRSGRSRMNDIWTSRSHDPSIAELEGRNLEPEQDELARETTPLLRNYTIPPQALPDDTTSLTSEGKRQVGTHICHECIVILERTNVATGTRSWYEASSKSSEFVVRPSDELRRRKVSTPRSMGFIWPKAI